MASGCGIRGGVMDPTPAYRKGWLTGRFDPRPATELADVMPSQMSASRLDFWQGHQTGADVRIILRGEAAHESGSRD